MLALLTRIFTEYTDRALFPEEVHQVYNSAWLIQSLLMFAWFIKTRRFFPSKIPASTKDLLVRQFDFALLIHSLFYILELACTGIFAKYREMHTHHVMSITLFAFMYIDKRLYSAFTTLPFILHQLLWVLIKTPYDYELLFAYNVCFSVVGLWLFAMIRRRRMGCWYVVPGLCVGIVCGNWIIHCGDFRGIVMCLPRDYKVYNSLMIGSAGLTGIAISYLCGRYA